jgi:hypothetical protein
MRSRVIILLLMSVLVLSVAAPAHMAMADDDRDKDEKEEGPKVEVTKGEDFIRFHNELKDSRNDTIDDFDFKVKTYQGLRFELSFQHREERIETDFWMEVTFRCMIGMQDGDDIEDLDCGRSNRHVMHFTEMEFKAPTHEQYKEKTKVKHKISIISKDYKFQAYISTSDQFVANDDGAQVPDSISMEFKIKHFEYEEKDTKLALVIKVESNTRTTLKDANGDSEALDRMMDDEMGSGHLTYEGRAEVNQEDRSIGVDTKQLDDGEIQVSFVYPKGEKIYHDMEMSLVPNVVTLKGHVPTYGASIAAVASLVILTDSRVIARLRRK